MTTTTLFLHSTGTGPFLWDGVGPDLLAGGTKLAPWNLGYGPAPIARGTTVTAEDDAKHAHAALLAHAPEGDVHLFAHSYGAFVALRLAPLLGARVKSLFLAEPVLFGALAAAKDADTDPEASAEARAFATQSWFLDDADRGGLDEWQALFIDYWNRPGSWQRMPEPMRAHALSVGWKMFQEVRACFYEATSFDAFPLPDAPTTIVRGVRSPKASRAMAAAVARRGPRARLVDLDGTGHMAPLTHPDILAAAMKDHVAWRAAV